MEPQALAPAVVPHLVSRIVFSGGGGLDSRTAGLVFMISPRVAWIEMAVGSGNTSDRPIFHCRHESHTNGTGLRIHLNCGDGNMSQTSLALRFGTTALVTMLAGRGLKPPRAARPCRPLVAMRAFARDPALRVAARCWDGRRRTAVQISRLHCQWVERHLAELPEWAPGMVQQWRGILDVLDSGGAAAASRLLDWAILYDIYLGALADHGLSADAVRRHSRKLALAERRLPPSETSEERIIGLPDLRRPVVRVALQLAGIDLAMAQKFLRLRAELAEIFTRYAEIGEDGLFHSMEQAGVLQHRIVDDHLLARSAAHPPADTRARARGELVREIGRGSSAQHVTINWSRVTDGAGNRRLDLGDPFATQANWQDLPVRSRPELARHDAISRMLGERMSEARTLYNQGRMDEAALVLDPIRPVLGRFPMPEDRAEFHRWDARIHARLGTSDAAARMERCVGGGIPTFRDIVDFTCIHRFAGLTPAPEIDAWIALGLRRLGEDANLLREAQSFLDHVGYTHLRRGQTTEALAALERARRIAPFEARIDARVQADYADALRAAGRFAEALEHLQTAEHMQLHQQIFGEHAEITCTAHARLAWSQGERREAIKWLKQAAAAITSQRSPIAFARIHLLHARIPGCAVLGTMRRAIESARDACPVLAACPLLTEALAHWEAWTSGAPSPSGHADVLFWGV